MKRARTLGRLGKGAAIGLLSSGLLLACGVLPLDAVEDGLPPFPDASLDGRGVSTDASDALDASHASDASRVSDGGEVADGSRLDASAMDGSDRDADMPDSSDGSEPDASARDAASDAPGDAATDANGDAGDAGATMDGGLCDPGEMPCGGMCLDPWSSLDEPPGPCDASTGCDACGPCEGRCGGGSVCIGRICACPPPTIACGALCVDPLDRRTKGDSPACVW